MKTRTLVLAALGVVLAAGCGVSKDAYRRDMQSLQGQIAELEDQKERLSRDKKDLTAQLDATSAEKGRATDAMLQAMRRVEELEAIAARRKAVFDKLRASLQEMVSAGKLRVVMKRGLMVVQMAEAILFDTGKAELKPEGVAAVGELTGILGAIPNRRFQIAGHTDNVGTEEVNWKLACSRALTVLKAMRDAGMPPDRVSVAGYAWFMPEAGNETEEGRAQNRRIEFVLQPNLEELEIPE